MQASSAQETGKLNDWARPLAGIGVLDLSQGVAAGFCARLFARLGAHVWRVTGGEGADVPLDVGHAPEELQRRLAGYLHAGKDSLDIAVCDGATSDLAPFLGKSQLVIHDRGEEFASQLLSVPDGQGTCVVSVSDYGWGGPCSEWRADSLLIQAHAGIAALIGSPDREPLALPGFAIHYATGSFAFITAMTMLMRTDREERHVLVTAIEAASTLHQYTYLAYTRLAEVRKRGQFMLPTALYMSCRDGEILLAPVRPNQWSALAVVCDRPDLLEQPVFNSVLGRRLYASVLDRELGPWFAKETAESAFEKLCEVGVPAAVVNSPGQALNDPQFAHRDFRPGAEGLPVPFLLNGQRPGNGVSA